MHIQPNTYVYIYWAPHNTRPIFLGTMTSGMFTRDARYPVTSLMIGSDLESETDISLCLNGAIKISHILLRSAK